jgi:hypothetical protein
MAKWLHITKNQYAGFFALGLAFFILQELPYIVMPLIPMEANPLMEMQDKSTILNVIEKILGVSCIVFMLFIVRGDVKCFSLRTTQEKAFFSIAMMAITVYFIGWILYFSGYQSLPLILGMLVAPPPVYYTFIGLWRGNTALAVSGCLFLLAHVANVRNNLQ